MSAIRREGPPSQVAAADVNRQVHEMIGVA